MQHTLTAAMFLIRLLTVHWKANISWKPCISRLPHLKGSTPWRWILKNATTVVAFAGRLLALKMKISFVYFLLTKICSFVVIFYLVIFFNISAVFQMYLLFIFQISNILMQLLIYNICLPFYIIIIFITIFILYLNVWSNIIMYLLTQNKSNTSIHYYTTFL